MTKKTTSNPDDPRLTPAIDLIKRNGAATYQVGYANDDEKAEGPVVWYALAGFRWHDGRPRSTGKVNRHEAAAALDPVTATLRLCAQLVDGGYCTHCQRPTRFVPSIIRESMAPGSICCYQWDPEGETFRRGCEDD